MSTEASILTQVETQLETISTANGYNLNILVVESPDEAINPVQMEQQSLLPAILIFYNPSGAMQSGFTDSARLGRTNTSLSLQIRAIVKDDGASNKKSILTGNVFEDIISSIGDSIRENVTGVYETRYSGRRQPVEFRGTPYSVLELLLDVLYDFETRQIVTPTPAALSIPTDIAFDLSGGEATITYTMPSGAAYVDIYRNGTKIVDNNTLSYYNDPNWWQWGTDAFYRLIFDDGAGNTVATEHLSFPYYPNTDPEVQYYLPVWTVAQAKIGQAVTGNSTPELIIENEIRKEIEYERLESRSLSDVAYTSAGPVSQPLTQSKFPYVAVEYTETNQPVFSQSQGEYDAAFLIHAYTLADTSQAARIANRVTANKIMYAIREIAKAKYNWNQKSNASNTILTRSQPAGEAVRFGNRLCFHSMIQINVRFSWTWRE